MPDLILTVGTDDYRAIKSGGKKAYHVPLTKPWISKLVRKQYENIVVSCKSANNQDDKVKVTMKYRGYRVVTIKSEQGEQKLFEIITKRM